MSTRYDYRAQWQKEGFEIPIARHNIGKETPPRECACDHCLRERSGTNGKSTS